MQEGAINANGRGLSRVVLGAPQQITWTEEIGSGGFCYVRQGQRYSDDGQPIGQSLAGKFLKEEYCTDQDVVARFQREVRLLNDELRHPHIVSVVARNVSDIPPWFAMPLASSNLARELASQSSGGLVRVTTIFLQVLEAMKYAHERGVIHRDLKPQNVLIDGDQVKVADFGLGKCLDGNTDLTKSHMWAGTEPYMPPEQFESMREVGEPADVFALGKLLIYMLTGHAPPVGVLDPSYIATIPEPFRYFTMRCCQHRAEDRFQNAGEALDCFSRLTSSAQTREPAEDALSHLVQNWYESPELVKLKVVKEIDELLHFQSSNEALFTAHFSKLPERLLEQYQRDIPDAFASVLRIYDDHISGGLPFSYCDEVAKLYRDIIRRSDRLDVLQLILTRLMIMGKTHNRFFVRDVVIQLLTSFTDPSRAAAAADVIKKNPFHAEWYVERAMRCRLPSSIESALRSIGDPGTVS